MKGRRFNKRHAFLFLFLGMLGTMYQALYSEHDYFSFDRLFPHNSYSKATEQCVRVWAAWDKLLQSGARSQIYFVRVLDCSLGQLVLANKIMRTIAEDEKKPHIEQLHYMSRVVGTVADRFIKLSHIDSDRHACLKKQIEKLKTILEKKLKE